MADDRTSAIGELVFVLRSIDRRIAETNELLRRQLPPVVATDEQLGGPKGDPLVAFDPKSWVGAKYKGKKFSACPPEYLDLLASAFDWSAAKKREEGDAKKAGWSELDAARARGWAARLRNGWLPPDEPAPSASGTGNPFAKRPASPPPAAVPAPTPAADDFDDANDDF